MSQAIINNYYNCNIINNTGNTIAGDCNITLCGDVAVSAISARCARLENENQWLRSQLEKYLLKDSDNERDNRLQIPEDC